MSLDVNVENVKDWQTKCKTVTDDFTPLVTAVAFLSRVIGLNEITKKNCKDFYARILMWERLATPFLQKLNNNGEVEGQPITLADVQSLIGLKTNASVTSWTKYLSKMQRYVASKVKEEQKKLANAA